MYNEMNQKLKTMKNKFLLTMAIALLLTACGKDDDGEGGENERTPITFTANIQSETMSRATVNHNWGGLSDSRIAIVIDGVMKEYTVNENGEITSDDPFYWDGQKGITVESWYPYCEGVKPETLVVHADQSIRENYEKSDHLEVTKEGVTSKKNVLTFTHRTTKMVCNLSAELGDLSKSRVILHGLTNVSEGTSIIMNSEHKALIVPQVVPVGTEFLEVQFEDGSRHVFTLEEELDLKKGLQKKADITITPEGIEVVFSDISSWIADTETPEGQSPGTNPGNSNDGWSNNNGETSSGSSPETNPNENTNGWAGGSENANGSTSEIDPDNGNGSWTGGSENANGSTSEVDPNNGNGSWTGSDENATGSVHEANPDNGNAGWAANPEEENVTGTQQ